MYFLLVLLCLHTQLTRDSCCQDMCLGILLFAPAQPEWLQSEARQALALQPLLSLPT